MHAHHHHGHQHPEAGSRPGSVSRRLGLVLALTATYTLAEVVGGLLSNSLALLADAGHMMTDNLALVIALLAAWSAKRPPDPSRTYGYQRIEIIAALLNGAALLAIAAYILWEAWERLSSPPEVEYRLMAVIAGGGLLVNLAGAIILYGAGTRNLNLRAAYLHVLGDMLGSLGALTAAILLALFGWRWADPAASAVIAVLIVVGSVRLILESVNVLMEGAPSHVKTSEVSELLLSVPGVDEIHDLHLWSLAGGTPLLTAHLVTDHSRPYGEILRDATDRVEERFGVTHATFQIEPPDYNIVRLSGDEPPH
jgi:cobalt-zinc-cadmium efflux system protein